MHGTHSALYAGSFDPLTKGHLDVLQRARGIFDEIVLGIGDNPDKPMFFTVDERVDMAEQLVAEVMESDPAGAPVQVHHYTGLTVEFAQEIGASVILRGIRNVTDLSTECQLAIMNRQVADIETVFIITGEQYAYTSSGLIRQIAVLGSDLNRLSHIVPPLVISRLRERLKEKDRDQPLLQVFEEND